jgi:hypothetical protein
MTPIYPLTDRDAGFAGSEARGSEKVIESIGGDIPPLISSGSTASTEFIFGPRQLASVAFVGILIIGLMSAIAYFAGRKNTNPQVTERVIERLVPAPQPVPQTAPPVVEHAATKPAEIAPSSIAVAPTPVTASWAGAKGNAVMTAPAFNRVYLQLGSVEVGVAEVMVEGLRQRGVPAIVGIGISGKVARVLVGPFNSPEEQQVAQKHVEELGFHPFQRVFTERDLEPQQPAAAVPATPVQPHVQAPVPQAPPQPPVAQAPPREKP